MNLPYRAPVWLVIHPQPLVDGACHGPLALEAKPPPVVGEPRRGLWAVAVLFTPISVFAVELGGLDLGVRFLDAPVLDEEGGHVVVLSELLCGVGDAGGNLEVSALLEAPQAFEGPVENPGALLLDVALDLRVALVFGQLRECDDLYAPEEPRVGVSHPRKLVHRPAYLCLRSPGERVVILARELDRLAGDDGVERVGRGKVRGWLLARHHERFAGQVCQCEPAALEVRQAEDPGTMPQHGLKTGYKRALTAPGRSEQPDGKLVSHLGSESVTCELLQEVRSRWYGVS